MRKVNRFLSWVLIAGSAALCADIGAASLDAYLSNNPSSIDIPAAQKGVRAGLSQENAQSIQTAFRQPEPPKPTKRKKVKKHVTISKTEPDAPLDTRDVTKAAMQGTIVSDSVRAIILEFNANDVEVISQGEMVGKYLLAEVAPTWARFENSNEELLFVADSMNLQSSGNNRKAAGPIVKKKSTVSVDNPDEQQDRDENLPEEAPPEEMPKDKVSLAEVREALNNTASVAQQLRVIPQERDGLPFGTRINFRDDTNLLARMGVKNGDVLLSINGIPTRNAEEMYRRGMEYAPRLNERHTTRRA